MNQRLSRLLLAGLAGTPLCAQSFADLTESRNPAQPYAKLFQIEGGAIATQAKGDAPAFGLDDDLSWDARVYYRNEGFSSRRGTLEAYDRDGAETAITSRGGKSPGSVSKKTTALGVVRFGGPLVLEQMGSFVMNSSDRFFIERDRDQLGGRKGLGHRLFNRIATERACA